MRRNNDKVLSFIEVEELDFDVRYFCAIRPDEVVEKKTERDF